MKRKWPYNCLVVIRPLANENVPTVMTRMVTTELPTQTNARGSCHGNRSDERPSRTHEAKWPEQRRLILTVVYSVSLA